MIFAIFIGLLIVLTGLLYLVRRTKEHEGKMIYTLARVMIHGGVIGMTMALMIMSVLKEKIIQAVGIMIIAAVFYTCSRWITNPKGMREDFRDQI